MNDFFDVDDDWGLNLDDDDDDGLDPKRTLTKAEKEDLWRNARKICEACYMPLEDFNDMEPGHKIAWANGGPTTVENSVCLCHKCNRRQRKKDWVIFVKQRFIEDEREINLKKYPGLKRKIDLKPISKNTQSKDTNINIKHSLEDLKVSQLKSLAGKYHIKPLGDLEEDDFGDSYRKAPTKKQYVNKLLGKVTQKDVDSLLKETPPKPKKKKKRQSDDSWF